MIFGLGVFDEVGREPTPGQAVLASLVDNAEDAIFALTLEGIVHLWNPAAERLFGFPAGEIVGKPVVPRLVPSDRKEEVARSLERIRRGELVPCHETVLLRSTGVPVHVSLSVSPIKDAAGRVIAAAFVARDIEEQARQLEELRRSEARLRTALALSPIFVWTQDRDLRFTWAFSPVSPIPIDSMIGRTDEELAPPGEAPEAILVKRRVLETGEGIRYEVGTRLLGDLHYIDVRMDPIRDAAGKVIGLAGAAWDVTDRVLAAKEAERAHAAERRLRAQLDAIARAHMVISEAVATLPDTDIRGLLQVIADQARIITGADYAAIGLGGTEKASFESWVPSGTDSPEWAALAGQAPRAWGLLGLVSHGETIRLPDVHQHPAFAAYPHQGPPLGSFIGVPIRHGGKILGGLFLANKPGGAEFTSEDEQSIEMLAVRAGVSIEIAQLKRAQALQRARLDYLASVSAVLATSIGLEETLGAIARLAVPKLADFCAVYLIEGDEIRLEAFAHREPEIGEHMFRRGHRFRFKVGEQLGPMWDVVTKRQPVIIPEYTLGMITAITADPEVERIDKELHPRSAMGVPLIARGRLLGIMTLVLTEPDRRFDSDDLSLANDLASRAALVIEKAMLYEEARAAARARDNLIAIVTHDLKNPLSTVQMSADLLRQAKPPSGGERILQRADTILRSVAQMKRLLSALGDAGMMEAGRFTVNPTRQEVPAILNEALQTHGPLAAQKSLCLEARLAPDLPPVRCDRERVLQVLTNLVDNAVKFTPEGGSICLEARRAGHYALLSVTDTGSGIPEDQLPHLFERYWRGEPTGRSGTGLGLFISKGIVEAHGGRIWVESKVGVGSTFCFSLPLDLPEP